MKTKEFLKEHEACKDGAKWALSISKKMGAVWNAMIKQGKRDWLIWTATRPGVFPGSVLQKLPCRFVRETPLSDGRKVWDLLTDERSRKAVEVAELYADGKATYEELKAAYDAAHATADTAYAAALATDATFAAAYAAYAASDAANFTAFAAYAIDAARAAYATDTAYATYAAAAYAAAAYAAARDAARAVARVAIGDAAYSAAYYAARNAAEAAQVQMIAETGNPFK